MQYAEKYAEVACAVHNKKCARTPFENWCKGTEKFGDMQVMFGEMMIYWCDLY